MTPFYEEGNYLGQVMSQAMTKAKTGTPQFVLRFKVLTYADGSSVPRQYERTMYRSITDKTMEYVKQDLETLGFKGTSLRQLDPNQGDFQDLSGIEVELYCKHEEGQDGELREKWMLSRQSSKAIEGDPVDGGTYRQLDVLFGANARGATPRPVTQAIRSQPHSTEITDEDIPF
jgi:hypothetical protein